MLFVWILIFVGLGWAVVSGLPGKVRIGALVLMVVTLWLFWASWGAEHLADALWPLESNAAAAAASAAPTTAAPAASAAASASAPGAGVESKTTRLGQVGDLFGGVNALFAALALAGVGVAAHQQWKNTQIAFRQATEATFFSALELHHRIVDGLRFNREAVFPSALIESALRVDAERPSASPYVGSTGRSVFADVVLGLGYTDDPCYESTRKNYERLQKEHNYVLGHYFRHLYQVLKLIDVDAELDAASKRKYAGLLRAQLSSDELVLLMLNCVDSMVDHGEFRTLVVKYRMLEHIPFVRENDVYLHAGSPVHIVIADQSVVDQYLLPASQRRGNRVYTGAFGTNPSVWVKT
jgi:Putative phage abortive infection protein